MLKLKKLPIYLFLILAIVFTLGLILPGTMAAAPAQASKSVSLTPLVAGSTVTTTQATQLYADAKASSSSKVLKRLPKAARMTVLYSTSKMVKVSTTDKIIGYAARKYLTVVAQPKTTKTPAKPVTLTISAAASLTDVMNEVQKLYMKENPNVTLTMNYGGSGSLQQQIEQGAPVDVFFSAANAQMDALQQKDLLLDGTRKVLLRNKLVLIVPKDSTKVQGFNDLTKSEVKNIACGEPGSVPAGKYAQDALTALDLWDKVNSKLVLAKDVRQVLAYVESGDADAGFVYLTDSLLSDKVKVVATADDKINATIVYPVAVIKDTKNEQAARDFLAFLSGAQTQTVYKKYGFTLAN
jgi:molybdate transport system substrate-binding protein